MRFTSSTLRRLPASHIFVTHFPVLANPESAKSRTEGYYRIMNKIAHRFCINPLITLVFALSYPTNLTARVFRPTRISYRKDYRRVWYACTNHDHGRSADDLAASRNRLPEPQCYGLLVKFEPTCRFSEKLSDHMCAYPSKPQGKVTCP